MKEPRSVISGVLSHDERAKLHALGGMAWVRLKLRDEAMPTGPRTIIMLTEAERALALDHRLRAADIARQLGVSSAAIDTLRMKARRARA